jgi:hypothetical protein
MTAMQLEAAANSGHGAVEKLQIRNNRAMVSVEPL